MIIVTGASRGLGQAISERLIERGEEVIGLVGNASGLNINAIECDVSDHAAVKNASKKVNRICKEFGFTADMLKGSLDEGRKKQ